MKSRQRRLKTIELDLTPQQVVVLWLRNALLAGTFEEGARRTPPPREAVGNAVRNTVRNSMKGQEASLVERAVLASDGGARRRSGRPPGVGQRVSRRRDGHRVGRRRARQHARRQRVG